MNLNHGVNKTEFYYSSFNSFLEEDSFMLQGSNIGYEGHNLTITFLSLNRIELSIKLLHSIKEHLLDFKGQVLIIDNGSEKNDLKKLKVECEQFAFSIRLVELEKNYGVAGGRNRTMEYVDTEWVMCLDNDIYFINNPIRQIQNDISLLGSHFLNIPLLDADKSTIFALGGHLYVSSHYGDITVGGGTCYKQIQLQLNPDEDNPFLSNFLFGGACVFKKSTFLKIGGFDENMFIGFEDIDFSVRLFREGYKVGNTKILSLVHDHPLPENEADIDYEKKRFSSNIIKESALYLEKKYGFKIWTTNLIKWLEEKNEFLGAEVPLEKVEQVGVNKKIKIALIMDVDNWAFGNIARQIEKNLNQNFDFSLINFKECEYNPNKLLLRASDCDILHFFWREMIPFFNEEYYTSYFGEIPTSFADFSSNYFDGKILSTCAYDHLFLKEDEINQRKEIFNKFHYYVCSNKLNKIYRNIDSYQDPVMVIEDGVDHNLFYPINTGRFENIDKAMTIGWVGNSNWASELGEDFKGFNTIIKPAIGQLKELGYQIESLYCDRVEKLVEHKEMVNYYANIDVLVCMSQIEGTPNPVLEAMACGIPVISTNVGIVSDVLGDKQKEFILNERSIESLKEAILRLYNNRDSLKELSLENLDKIKDWFWIKQSLKFKEYFEKLYLMK